MKQRIEDILNEITMNAQFLEGAATAGGDTQHAFDLMHDRQELEKVSRILAEHVHRIETETAA